MARHVAANVLTLVIVALLVVAGVIAWGQREFTSAGPLEQAICLRVERGASLPAVAQQLAEEGAISHARVFRVGANYTGKAGELRFGSYLVPPEASMEEILDILTRGGASTCGTEVNFRIGVTRADTQVREVDPETGRFAEVLAFAYDVEEIPEEYAELTEEADTRFRVILAEGVTSWQVAEALRAAPFLSGEIDAVPAEGSLAPDSYEVTRGAERATLLDRMQAAQAAILEELWETRADDLPYDSPEEALIMASIIEKETSVPDERWQVASVFVNRLRVPMRLQTDPTVIYGVTEGRGTLGRGLRRSELDTPTPYNTYQVDGLPPTPIANPGRASIAAALDPDDTPYLYFVADGTGGHTFSTNLADHNRAVARWRQIEAERNAPQE